MTDSQATHKPRAHPGPVKVQRITVPMDFSEPSDRALDFAVMLAGHFEASLNLVHVHSTSLPAPSGAAAEIPVATVPIPETAERDAAARTRLDSLVERCIAAGVPAKSDVVTGAGDTPRALVAAAAEERSDLIVMGTHGRSGLKRAILGSVAEGVLRHSPIPVLTVPSNDPKRAS